MSTVADPDVVDIVGQYEDGRVILYIMVPRTWYDAPEQVEQLRVKLNTYQAWIASGGCQQQYPAAAKGVDIVTICLDEPTGEAAQLLLMAREGLQQRGIGCYYQTAVS